MRIFLALCCVAWIVFVLFDGFETLVLPRRVSRSFRYARYFYLGLWRLWRTLAIWLRQGKRRDNFLSYFGPISILALFVSWVLALILGFACLHASLGTLLNAPEQRTNFLTYLYLSGGTFFTFAPGEVTPVHTFGRFLTVAEAGTGFGFIAIIIGYLPVLYQAFSHRELTISMLDARAGSPPSAGELFTRLARARQLRSVSRFLAEWERWAGELLESHLSFPVLTYYRSQHDNQSWLAALTFILDSSALVLAAVKDADAYQAQLAFAMARHAAVDLAMVLHTPPLPPDPDRLPAPEWERLCRSLQEAGLALHERTAVASKLAELRSTYEPFVNALARRLLLSLPVWLPEKAVVDNWQTSAWMRRTAGISNLPLSEADREHLD
ncbi:MAG TPA: potassium channel family protein [Gemmataceae bacterium]|jgi:hypothetical protein|nr:potassium channel family protein [Gemmataceae bacterium]